MANFAELKTRVLETIIDNPASVVSAVPGFINQVIRRAQDRHNFRFMEETIEFVTVASQRNLGAVPERYKEKRADPWILEDNETREIDWLASQSDAIRGYNDDPAVDVGAPREILESETAFDVYPYPNGQSLDPDGEYRVNIPYWRYLPDLVEDTDNNWLTDNAADYVAWAATGEAFLFLENEARATIYITRAGGSTEGPLTGELGRIVSVDKRSRLQRRLTLTPKKGVYTTYSGSRRGRRWGI